MRYLILSDIHSNWEALEAVIEATKGTYDRALCCGDLVGYGPDPNPVVDWVRTNCQVVIRGNHDRAAVGLEDLEWFNPIARTAAEWTLKTLTPVNRDYILRLPQGPVAVDGFLLAHGSPLDEDEYLVHATEAAHQFPYVSHNLTFIGHTHLQGGFAWNGKRATQVCRAPQECQLDGETQYFINPGSVGQPRDSNPQAAYVIYEPEKRFVKFGRVPYDVGAVQKKIRDAGLHTTLADRLSLGR